MGEVVLEFLFIYRLALDETAFEILSVGPGKVEFAADMSVEQREAKGCCYLVKNTEITQRPPPERKFQGFRIFCDGVIILVLKDHLEPGP